MITPALSLDFTPGVLDLRITLSRANNTATAVNSSGYVATVNANLPRFDYDPISKSCRGLLVEESRENVLTYSADKTNGVWLVFQSAKTGSAAISPTGNMDAIKHTELATTTSHELYRSYTLTAEKWTLSRVIKKAERSKIRMYMVNGTTSGVKCIFDLDAGTKGAVTNVGSTVDGEASIQNMGDGWYRCSITCTASANSFIIGQELITGTSTSVYLGVLGSGVFVWNDQLEKGAFPTSDIVTTTAALTRNADVATITGTAFSGFWRSGPGSILIRALPSTVSGTRPLVQVDDATADNIIALRGNTTNPELYIRAGGADQATIDAGTISAAAYRLAGAWQAGSAAASLNSGLAVNGAPASIPAATQMRLGSDGTNYLNGHLQAVEYWPVRLSNASLQNASSTAGYQSIIHPVSRDTIITEPV